MKAKVTEISSGQQYTDGERRVTLRVEEADGMFNSLRIPLSKLNLKEIELDEELEITIRRPFTMNETDQQISNLARKMEVRGSF
jgi:hypothetical protein